MMPEEMDIPRTLKRLMAACMCVLLASVMAPAEVRLSKLFGDHMVLQRGKAVAVFGAAAEGETVSVSFGGHVCRATADGTGTWQVMLPGMAANTNAQEMTIAASNTIVFRDVVVGDVWICSGQSNMDMALAGCNRAEDIGKADLPGIRSFRVPTAAAGAPLRGVRGNPSWLVCSPRTAGGFSATAFYFARRVYRENKGCIPIGLLVASVGGTPIDLWLTPEGVVDVPELHPLLKQPVLPGGPFHLAYGMIHPLAPYGIRGAIWYQGENAEKTVQSEDSYYLKMKALVRGWQRLWAMDDFAFYYVMIANWGELPRSAVPVFKAGGWDADTRLQQANAMALPHAGCASAIDIGDSSMGDKTWEGWHPKGKLDVGERLALWALKNDYGRPETVASGPVLRDVAVDGPAVACSFDHVGEGLMVGSKSWYEPTREAHDVPLKHFVIAGDDGKWFPAGAVIHGDRVIMSSPAVKEPRMVSYACWQNPEGCNLYNRDGLPAAPFHVEDVYRRYRVTAAARDGGSISPAGEIRLLERKTALFEIRPDDDYHIVDVKVDGVSVGSVSSYSFDPVRADHTIEAVFGRRPPTYTISASAGAGGALMPNGRVEVSQGDSRTFTVVPKDGLSIRSLIVDGVDIGCREGYTFCDIRENHTIESTFACRIETEAGFGGTIAPCGEILAVFNEGLEFKIAPLPGHEIADVVVDGKSLGARKTLMLSHVTSAHKVSATFKGGVMESEGGIPRADHLVFACFAETLPAASGPPGWKAAFPGSACLTPIGTPETVQVAGRGYSRNLYLDGDGFSYSTHREPIVCKGASIVVVARPIRDGSNSGWFSIVDVFYDRLVLGIRNDTGQVCVRRNGTLDVSESAVPDGQITILSLVVQPDGTYCVYANGERVLTNRTSSPMHALVPGVAGGFAHSITVGRNAPDAWTTFNGDIGDVFLYRVALSNEERNQLEAQIAGRLLSAK